MPCYSTRRQYYMKHYLLFVLALLVKSRLFNANIRTIIDQWRIRYCLARSSRFLRMKRDNNC